MNAYQPLWRVVSGSAVVIHGRVAGLEPPRSARVDVLAALRGDGPRAAQLVVEAPEPNIEAPRFRWTDGGEVVVALGAGEPLAPAARPHLRHYGLLSLDLDRDGTLAAVRDVCRLCAAPPPAEGAAALLDLLRRDAPGLSRIAALDALIGFPGRRPYIDPAVVAEVASLAASADRVLRAGALWACGGLPALALVIDRLLDALDDDRPDVRSAAGAGLIELTGERFGFEAAGDLDRRAIAAARWRRWRGRVHLA